MNKPNPILLSLLTLAGLLPLLLAWEFLVEPAVFTDIESTEKRWEFVVMGMVCATVALIVPTALAVRDSRARAAAESVLLDAIETIPEGFVLYDADGRLVICNTRFREFYGYSEAEAAPGVTWMALGELDAERGVSIEGKTGREFVELRNAFRAGHAGEQELQLADGRWISTRERITRDGGLVSVQADISGLKSVQAALAESERHLRDALENVSDAFVYFDGDGRLVLCNERYRSLYGYTRDEVAPGTSRQELGNIDRRRGVIGPPEHVEEFLASRRAQLTEGIREMAFEFADGRWIMSRARKLDDGSVVSIQTDITELKRVEAKLARSEQLLLDAIENLEEGFVYFDADDRLVIANNRYKEMFPAQKDIAPGIRFEDAVMLSVNAGEVPRALGREVEWMARRLEQHRTFRQVDEQHLVDGRWVKVSERRTSDGGSVGLRTDITALKESQMAAEAANRAKTAFLAHMSHELRTPLNSIIGFSEVLREEVFGALSDQYRDYAGHIHRSGVHLLTLINDILDISKVEVGELQPADEDVNVAAVVSDCLTMMRPRATEKGLRLEMAVPDSLPTLRVDPRHLKQVLINLISNAVKFTARDGYVTVSGEFRPAVGLRISVTDNGIGISAADQAELFVPFARVENPETLAQDGTGLGLYLVKSMTELNGGEVSLVSRLGEGTTVTVSFPTERTGGVPAVLAERALIPSCKKFDSLRDC